MIRADDWEEAFVAMSVAVGETREDAVKALGPREAARVLPFVRSLAAPTKISRAHALASALGEVLRDVLAMGLA